MRIEEFNPNIAEIAEEVLLGPQAEVIQQINNFNDRYGTTIKSTKTFRWSPGVGEQLKEIYQKHVLDWDKRYSGVYQFFNRVDNRIYHHRSMQRTLNNINDLMTGMRSRGITFQNNSDLVVETFNNMKNKALEEVESIESMYSEQDLTIDAQVYERDQGGFYYRIEFNLPNPVMSIDSLNTDGEYDHLVDIKLYPVVLKFEIDFISHINRMASSSNNTNYNTTLWGKTIAPSDTVYHPYIYSRGQHREWCSVCLGDLQGDIHKAVFNFDFMAAAMLLTQWTTQYTVNRTHPHNKRNTAYYGLPKYIKDQENSAAYISAFPHNPNSCGVPAAIYAMKTEREQDTAIVMDNTCNGIDCQMKDVCDYYTNVVNVSQERVDNIVNINGCVDEFIHSLVFSYRDCSDAYLEKAVQDQIEYIAGDQHCTHGIHYDNPCDVCIEEGVQEHQAAMEESMTDEDRIRAWYERNITERSR